MTQILNQFSQSQEKGLLDQRFNMNTVSAIVHTSNTLSPGQPVKLVDGSTGTPVVEALAADTDEIFGFVNYNGKDQTFEAGEPVEISRGGNVMIMEASAAIVRGAKVMAVISGTKVATATVGKTVAGYAYDKAAGNGSLIRVWIAEGYALPGLVQAANVAALAGTLTGTVDGTIEDVAAVSTAGGNTYSDAAINTAITSINLQLKEIQTVLNAEIAALKAARLQASS